MKCHIAVTHVQEPEEEDAPTVVGSPDGSPQSGEVTAIDESTMGEEDLQEAVGLLTQLEARVPLVRSVSAAPQRLMLPVCPLQNSR